MEQGLLDGLGLPKFPKTALLHQRIPVVKIPMPKLVTMTFVVFNHGDFL
jgi:hypothetical protein